MIPSVAVPARRAHCQGRLASAASASAGSALAAACGTTAAGHDYYVTGRDHTGAGPGPGRASVTQARLS